MTDTERHAILTSHEDLQARLVVLKISLKEQADILQEQLASVETIVCEVKAMAALLRREGD